MAVSWLSFQRMCPIFPLLNDTVMAEWWDGAFEARYYRPYRKGVDRALREMQQDGRRLSNARAAAKPMKAPPHARVRSDHPTQEKRPRCHDRYADAWAI